MQIERLEDRPEQQERVDALRACGDDPAVRVADAIPIYDRAAGEGCGTRMKYFR